MDHLTHSLAKDMHSATTRDKFSAIVLATRDSIAENWIRTQQEYYRADAKRVYYLSLEFLMGRLLRSYALSLGADDKFRKA
ncbi:MAG: hypothetical protein M0Z75_02770, partial [Nitrospiraceae bacterium]|nr:hypothetical protein [Nitrospiraceae bacterium]